MNTRKDEQWLDGELRRVINTSEPQFDAEAWKRKHAGAYEVLTSRGRKTLDVGFRTNGRRRLFVGTLAAAAVILMGVAILLTPTPPQHQPEPGVGAAAKATSPADIVSMIALRTAYRRGGEEALNQQLDKALNTLGPRPDGLSTLQVLHDLNG